MSSLEYAEVAGLQLVLQHLKSLKNPTEDELSVMRWIPDRINELKYKSGSVA